MLRSALLLIAGLCVLGGLVFGVRNAGIAWFPALELIAFGVVLFASLLWERRYRARVDRTRGEWQDTGERNIDPASGDVIAVFYNPRTGERDYRNVVRPG